MQHCLRFGLSQNLGTLQKQDPQKLKYIGLVEAGFAALSSDELNSTFIEIDLDIPEFSD